MNNQAKLTADIIRLAENRLNRTVEHFSTWLKVIDASGMAIVYRDPTDPTRAICNKAATLALSSYQGEMEPSLLEKVLPSYLYADPDTILWLPTPGETSPRREQLSARENEVLQWLDAGKSSPEIAIILGVSPRTIEKHRENIRKKLIG